MENKANKAFETQGLSVKVEWVEDDASDLSDLGTYTSGPEDFTIDRHRGLFLGAWLPEPEYEDHVPVSSEGAGDGGVFYTEDELDKFEDDFDDIHEDWEKHGQMVLAEVSQDCDRWSYRYFKPENYPGEWEHVGDDRVLEGFEHQKAKFSRFGIDVPKNPTREEMIGVLDVLYACQDYERAESYGKDWWFVGCVVVLSVDGIEVGRDSLWGIESDFDDDYVDEVESGCLRRALTEAKERV